DEPGLGHPEQPAAEGGGEPPREAVPVGVEVDVAGADDGEDVVAEQVVVPEPQAAEVPDPQADGQQHHDRGQGAGHVEAWHYAAAGGKASCWPGGAPAVAFSAPAAYSGRYAARPARPPRSRCDGGTDGARPRPSARMGQRLRSGGRL